MDIELVSYLQSDWTENKRDRLHAGATQLLLDAGITHRGISVGASPFASWVTVTDPSASVATALASSAYDCWYTSDLAARDAADIHAAAKRTAAPLAI